MSSGALADFVSALALAAVIEGIVIAISSSRISDLLERLRDLDPEQVRWTGLGMAVCGTLVYLWVRA